MKNFIGIFLLLLLPIHVLAIEGTSTPVEVVMGISQALDVTVSNVQLGNFATGVSSGGELTMSNTTCTTSGTGDVVALSNAKSCGALTVSGVSGQAITISLGNNGNFTMSDGVHTIPGVLTLSGTSCYASGGTPLCSEIHVGAILTIGGTDANPAGSYSTANVGGSSGTLSIQYT